MELQTSAGNTAQKMKFSIKDLKKSLIENFIFCASNSKKMSGR